VDHLVRRGGSDREEVQFPLPPKAQAASSAVRPMTASADSNPAKTNGIFRHCHKSFALSGHKEPRCAEV